jgi:hypothetical protein
VGGGCRAPATVRPIKLHELLSLAERHRGPAVLRENLGDGFLLAHNPFYRRVRHAALRAGFRFTTRDPGAYFGFPLTALDTVLETRRIPYRDNVAAVRHLERARPGFFELGDLRLNRPTPNYVLHESAHAVAFHQLFGRPKSVHGALSEDGALLGIELGEAFAMTTEYFASAAVQGSLHRFLFSVNSYRQRTPGKVAVGEIASEIGLRRAAHGILLAFLNNLFLRERLPKARIERLLNMSGPLPRPALRERFGRALNALMVMDPDFRTDTTRLFLAMFGRGRNVRRTLAADPLALLEQDDEAQRRTLALVAMLTEDRPMRPRPNRE